MSFSRHRNPITKRPPPCRFRPALDRLEDRLTESAGAPPATPRKPGILIVDDEEGVRGVLKIWLRQQGFVVWLAADGQEALEMYRCHRQTIEVVLLDVCMPGLDGPQTLAALQVLNPHIRYCFMTGDIGVHTEEELSNSSGTAVISKPFRLTEVAETLWKVAGKAELRAICV